MEAPARHLSAFFFLGSRGFTYTVLTLIWEGAVDGSEDP